MSRVLEAADYPFKPQLKFGIHPSEGLFGDVGEMIKITTASGEDAGDEPMELSGERPFCDADMSFWFQNSVSFKREIAVQGTNIRELLHGDGFATDYKKEPLGISIGICLQSSLYLPPMRLFLSEDNVDLDLWLNSSPAQVSYKFRNLSGWS